MYTKIYDNTTQVGAIHQGSLSLIEASFSINLPEQLGTSFFADRAVANIEAELADRGVILLKTEIWEDSSPSWRTDYQVKLWAAGKSPVLPAVIVALPWIIKGAIILSLLVAVVVVSDVVIGKVTDLFWGPPGPDGKQQENLFGIPVGGLIIAAAVIAAILLFKGNPFKAKGD